MKDLLTHWVYRMAEWCVYLYGTLAPFLTGFLGERKWGWEDDSLGY